MRKLAFVFSTGLCCILFACNNANNGEGNNSQQEKNRQANRDLIKGIETGDTSKFGIIADDAVDHAGPGGELRGAAAIRSVLTDMHNHVTDLKFEIKDDAVHG